MPEPAAPVVLTRAPDLRADDDLRVPPHVAHGQGAPDPFAGVSPIASLSDILGGLPDERTAEEIIADIRADREALGTRWSP